MNDETVTSKEAAFMLDTSMEEDMQSYKQEITTHVIKTINKSPKLYATIKEIKEARTSPNQMIKNVCVDLASKHNDEFGDLFITELEDVDWNEVSRRV